MTNPRQFTLEFVFVEFYLLGLTLGIARYGIVAGSPFALLVATIPAAAFIGRIFGVDAMWKTAVVVFLIVAAVVIYSLLKA